VANQMGVQKVSSQPDRPYINQGIANLGSGTVNFNAPVEFKQARVPDAENADQRRDIEPGMRWDLGVITVLTEETRAVTGVLARLGTYRARELDDGTRFEEAVIETGGWRIGIVSTRALDRGILSASIAFDKLQYHYSPAVVAMTGIAGGIHPSVQLGDVVLALEVINYDQRKETTAGPRRRGSSLRVPATVRRAVNNFFSDNGEPCRMTVTDPDSVTRTFDIYDGIIGSGSAVVADSLSDIRTYLANFNDTTLAVETESAGISQTFYEQADAGHARGWLGIRGIADHADTAKDDRFHDIASWHAAAALERLAPYLAHGT
jgi:adenosylhomocysteine nucleosidase